MNIAQVLTRYGRHDNGCISEGPACCSCGFKDYVASLERPMALPTIHLNGTSARDLLDQNRAAAFALRLAMGNLQAAGPNGRDYYPQGPSAIAQAQEEHQGRLEALEGVLQDLDAIAEHLCHAIAEQGRRQGAR